MSWGYLAATLHLQKSNSALLASVVRQQFGLFLDLWNHVASRQCHLCYLTAPFKVKCKTVKNTGSHCLLARIFKAPHQPWYFSALLCSTKTYFVANRYRGACTEVVNYLINFGSLKLLWQSPRIWYPALTVTDVSKSLAKKVWMMNANATRAAFVTKVWVKPPKGQAVSLSSSTHMARSVYHQPSWQVVPHPRTYMSSSTARPHPPSAEEVAGKGRRGAFAARVIFLPRSLSDKRVCSFVSGATLNQEEVEHRKNLKGLLIRKASV